MGVIHTRADWDQLVHAPSVQGPRGCLCMTCGRLVDSEGLAEGYPYEPGGMVPEIIERADGSSYATGQLVYREPSEGSPTAKWLVRHHGSDELRTFDMGSTNWDLADLAQMARRTNWFDPRHESLGLGHTNDAPGEHDDGPAKIVSFGNGPRT